MSFISFIQTIKLYFRSAGYKSDQKGIIRRYYREYNNWQLHLNNSKAFIDRSTQEFTKGNVAVLGSGWLLDVPIELLEKRFDKVYLFDITHPTVLKRKYKNNEKIVFVTCDLTNGLVEQVKRVKSFSDFMNYFEAAKPFRFTEDIDYVISINLLNQLDILLCDYLQRRFKVNDGQLLNVRQKIQENHLAVFENIQGCLISDCIEVKIDKHDQSTEKELIHIDLNRYQVSDSWLWIFDTNYTYHQKHNTSFKVRAYNL